MRLRLIGLALVLTMGMALGATIAQADVKSCIARNGTRFLAPRDAVTAQYVDVAAACRAAEAGGTDGSISVSGGEDWRSGPAGAGPSGSSAASATAIPAAAVTAHTIDKALADDAADSAGPLAGLSALPWQYWLAVALGIAIAAAVALRTRYLRKNAG